MTVKEQMRRDWLRYLVAGGAAIAVFVALSGVPTAQSLLFVGLHLSSVVALVVGVRRAGVAGQTAWRVMVLAWGLYLVGNVIWYIAPVALGIELGYPSLADAVYLAAYPALVISLWLVNRARAGDGERAGGIDTAIVILGLGALTWEILIAPTAADPDLSLLTRLVSIAYPLVDLLLLGSMVRMALARGRRTPSFWFLSLGIIGQLTSDIVYSVTSLNGTFAYGRWFFLGWMVFYVLVGAAALHPTVPTLTEYKGIPALTRIRVVFLALSALIPLFVLAHDVVLDDATHSIIYVCLSGIVFLLVLVRLNNLAADLEERKRLERLKDEFISVVSHELRTPLTSIRGALGLVSGGVMGELPDKAKHMLDIATTNTDRLVRLINDILDIERMESGRAPLVRRRCDLQELTTRSAAALQGLAHDADVRLSVSASSVPLHADADRIEQALTNLIGNAVKFSHPGGTVRITAGQRDGEAFVDVQDEGRGIPNDQLESVFGRFEQVDAGDARDKGGTGLGLAITRSIVTQHGGRIWAENAPAAGASFTFTLPLVSNPVPVGPSRAAAPQIVVCDDDPSVLLVVCALLEDRGYEVVPTASGAETLAAARERQPAAIVLDLLMPGMSGGDTLAALKADPSTRDIPVVILSVLGEDEAAIPEDRAEGWVRKPLDDASLFEALRTALTGPERTQRVLVVEDDPDLAAVLMASLSDHGFEGHHAASGLEAISLSRRVAPSLVLLDVMLPGADGFEVVDRLREDGQLKHVPLVVYSAADLTQQDKSRLLLGETEFLVKARVSPEQANDRVVEILARVAGDKVPRP